MTVATPVDFDAYGSTPFRAEAGRYTGAGIRTHRIVPATPEADWDAPHGRDRLTPQ